MKPHSILLVEDDSDLGVATQALLRQNAYCVSWVRDVPHAVLQLCNPPDIPWDLMMLDLDLNGERGETVVHVAKHEGCHVPPIVIVSAQSESECWASARAVRACDVLNKPLQPDRLLSTIRRILS